MRGTEAVRGGQRSCVTSLSPLLFTPCQTSLWLLFLRPRASVTPGPPHPGALGPSHPQLQGPAAPLGRGDNVTSEGTNDADPPLSVPRRLREAG